MKFRTMMKKTIITILIISLVILNVHAQKNQKETVLKREVTLYNPYKPSLQDVAKKSFLPDMNDSVTVKPVFKYDIQPEPFVPTYTVSPIKPASLLPDPLPKLYKSYVNIGIGNYLTPLAEISITNERSKKGAIGIDARHFSTNGNVKLQNNKKAFAGYMDNDVSLFGKKYLKNSIFNGSVDLSQKTRYAYGYDTIFKNYECIITNISNDASFKNITIDFQISKKDSLKIFEPNIIPIEPASIYTNKKDSVDQRLLEFKISVIQPGDKYKLTFKGIAKSNAGNLNPHLYLTSDSSVRTIKKSLKTFMIKYYIAINTILLLIWIFLIVLYLFKLKNYENKTVNS